MIKLAVICAVLLALLHSNVFAGISLEGKIETKKEDAKIFPNPGKPAASNTSHSGRITNGLEGRTEYFPYLMHLRVGYRDGMGSVCGASIISYTFALTAAHCMRNVVSASLYGGSASRDRGGIVFKISWFIMHPNYNPYTRISDYDVAVLRVRGTFQGYNNVVPIALQDAEVPDGTWCFTAGWGVNNITTQTSPEIVQYAFLQATPPEKCSTTWPGFSTIFCAQHGNGVNICMGDSGGPLICNGKLTGASSFVSGYCLSEYPSAFAKVMNPSIRQFIRQYTGV